MVDTHSKEVFKLANGLPCGRNTLKLAMTEAELEAVFRLRFKIFNDELSEGIPENARLGLDVDGFDKHCDHLMVLDHTLVVGTYRLLYGKKRPPQGFYTESEFNIGALGLDYDQVVELGRGCIDAEHRKRTTLMALFWGLHHYMDMRKARYLLGCASMPPMSADDMEATYEDLKNSGKLKHVDGVGPLSANAFKGDAAKGKVLIPPLVTLYLEFGAQIIGRPAYDPIFKCYDFFMLFDMEHLTEWGNELLRRFDKRLLAASEAKD